MFCHTQNEKEKENFALETSWKDKKNFRDSAAIFLILTTCFQHSLTILLFFTHVCQTVTAKKHGKTPAPHLDGKFFVDLVGLGILRDDTANQSFKKRKTKPQTKQVSFFSKLFLLKFLGQLR